MQSILMIMEMALRRVQRAVCLRGLEAMDISSSVLRTLDVNQLRTMYFDGMLCRCDVVFDDVVARHKRQFAADGDYGYGNFGFSDPFSNIGTTPPPRNEDTSRIWRNDDTSSLGSVGRGGVAPKFEKGSEKSKISP